MANHGRISGLVKQGIIAARALGARNREITARFRVSEATVTRTVREARIGELSRELETNWSGTLINAAKNAVLDSLEDPEQYNRGKIGVSVLKGLGLFQTGKGGDVNTAIQNNYYGNLNDAELEKLVEEKERLLDRAAKAGLLSEQEIQELQEIKDGNHNV